MDRTEISEIFCGAVDAIVTERLKKLAYDITKSYTIIEDKFKKQGRYTVSDGSVSFEAYSYDKNLKIDDVVMVTIPNGDYSNNKVIIALLEPDLPEVSEDYASQLDLMQIFSNNIMDHGKPVDPNEGLLANGYGGSSYVHLYDIQNNKGDLSGYTRLGISAEFQSLLNNADVVKGNYGLKFYIYSVLPTPPGQAKKDGVYELFLDSADMIGNPYSFSAYSKQEKVIDISMIENITKIEVYFYQNGNFEDSNGNAIDWQYIGDIVGLDSGIMPNNLFVKNLKMYLGYEAGAYESDKMVIHCEDSNVYSYIDFDGAKNSNYIKHLELKWLHKFTDGNETESKYEFMNQSSLNAMGITLKWFRYNLNAKEIDKFAGRGWEEIKLTGSNTPFKCIFAPDRNLAEEKIKVIGYKINITYESSQKLLNNNEYLEAWQQMRNQRYIKDKVGLITEEAFNNRDWDYYESEQASNPATVYNPDLEYYELRYKTDEAFNEALEAIKYNYLDSIESTDLYESDVFTLTNAVKVYDSLTFGASSSLSIYYEDGSEGNYFIYDSNGRLINQGQGKGYERRMRAVYNGKEITAELGTLDYIAWYLPTGQNAKTMLLDTQTYYTKDNGYISEALEEYQGVQYLCIKRYANRTDNTLNTWQSYSINSNWNNAYTNNLVRCEVSIDGVVYVAQNTMRFGKAGTQGTNTTLILEMQDNHNAITVPTPDGVEYCVVAICYDVNGNQLSSIAGKWEWNWKTTMLKNSSGADLIEIIEDEDEPNKVYLKANFKSLKTVSSGYYGVLQATYKQINGIDLVAYLNIPLKAPGCSHIEGASEINYGSGGSPQYYSDAYKIFMDNNSEGTNNPFIENYDVDWDVVHDINYYKLDKDGKRIINDYTGEYEISDMSADYIPKLYQLIRNGRTYQGLQAAPFYASGYDEICLICKDKTTSDILWVQPLLITSSKYDYSILNEWDGKLVTDEGTGTVMSTIIGAGRKNEDNTFSGILMGDVQDLNDTTAGGSYILKGKLDKATFDAGTYYYLLNDKYVLADKADYDSNESYYTLRAATGLYGFRDGVISFSLKDNGVATFGKADRGQIIIDGNSSQITSQGYKTSGNGMLLDLDDGQLSIKDNDRTRFQLQPTEPYLLINGVSTSTPMIYVGSEECYLQSESRSLGSRGAKLDLVRGLFDIKGTGGNILLSGREEDPFFEVKTYDGSTLIHMDTDGYYLQSAGFEGDSDIRVTNDGMRLEIYQEKDYVPIIINPKLFNNEKTKYYTYNSSTGKYVQVKSSDTFSKETDYYRRGQPSKVFYGYDRINGELYLLNFDSATNNYTAKERLDVYASDENGDFIYPILEQVVRYEEELIYTNKGYLTQAQFNSGTYYIKVNDQYVVATEYGEYVEYYAYSKTEYYAVTIDLSNLDEDQLIPYLVDRYVNTTLTPIRNEAIPSGMKLDLVNGRIEGYNLKLVGTQIVNNKVTNRLVINTEDQKTPVRIGGGFQIDWDGTLSCTKVKTITNSGNIPSIPKGVYGASTPPLIYIVDETKVDENGNPIVLFELNNNGTSTFNGTATSAATAEVANSLAMGDDFWGQINDHGNRNYVSRTTATKVYGPLDAKTSLDSRISTNLSSINSLNEKQIALETQLSNALDTIGRLESRIQELENKIGF